MKTLKIFFGSLLFIAITGCGSSGGDDSSSGGDEKVQVTDFSDPAVINDYDVKTVGLDATSKSLKLPSANTKAFSSKDESTFPFIWIANSGESTISKIDVNTGDELGRYKTGPAGSTWTYNPSRTTVDQDGNVWVGNRGGKTVTKIGLKEWDQCIDRNGNGVIDTSTGGTDVRDWTGSKEDGLGVANAEDECILQHVILTKDGLTADAVRLVAIDVDNNLIAGGSSSNAIFKVNPVTGVIISAAATSKSHYGGVVDKHGNIWSMPSNHDGTVQKISGDFSKNEVISLGHNGYGIAIDKYGKVWTTEIWGNRFSTFDPADPVGSLQVFTQTDSSSAQGIATDGNGDVFIAGSLGGSTVGHYRQKFDANGNFTGITFVANYTVGSGPTGVAVDGNGLVWSSNYYDSSVSRIDPVSGDVDTYPVGLNPYNYSDMTGNVVRNITKRQGTWEATFDSEENDYAWIKVAWALKVALPKGTSVEVFVKAANEKIALNGEIYKEIENAKDLVDIKGRYLKVKVQLASDDLISTPEVTEVSVF